MARELKLLETNLKSEEIIKFYLVSLQILTYVIKTTMFYSDFLYFSSALFDWGSTKMHLFSDSWNRKGVGC